MAQTQLNEGLEKAKAFFSRAEEVTSTGNYDYAIDMYIEGLRRAPDAVKEGHVPIRDVALLRQNKGGKKPSMMDKLKRTTTRHKDSVEEMLSQEWLFARDPDNIGYAESFLKAASAAGCKQTAAWMADMLFETNKSSAKPSFSTYMMLKESFAAAKQWDKALKALQYAKNMKPEDLALADELKNLSAELAMDRGKYDQGGDFRQSIRNKEEQEKLQAQDAVVKTDDYKTLAIKAARERLAKNPDANDAVMKLADPLVDVGGEVNIKEALDLLEAKFAQKNEFTFKRRAGEVRIKIHGRHLREARAKVEANPHDAAAKSQYEKLYSDMLRVELDHYKACVEQYPTDGRMKYEYGLRLMRAKHFDEAIPLFQDAQRDPRNKILAMDKMGMCFFMKGWYSDAADIFRRAAEEYEIKDDATAKDLRYNLARAMEEQGETAEALEIYRKLAQLDFGFKDVRQRVDKLRPPKQ